MGSYVWALGCDLGARLSLTWYQLLSCRVEMGVTQSDAACGSFDILVVLAEVLQGSASKVWSFRSLVLEIRERAGNLTSRAHRNTVIQAVAKTNLYSACLGAALVISQIQISRQRFRAHGTDDQLHATM